MIRRISRLFSRLIMNHRAAAEVTTTATGLCLALFLTASLTASLLPSGATAATGRRNAPPPPAAPPSSLFRLSNPYDVPQQPCRQGFMSVWDIGFKEWRCVMDGGFNIGDSGGGS